MMKPQAMLGAVVAALALSSAPGISQQASQAPAREGPTLILTAKVPLTGVSGRIDHFTFDAKRRLTIFSGLGNNTIEIVNNFQGKHVKTIMGLDEPPRTALRSGIRQVVRGQCRQWCGQR